MTRTQSHITERIGVSTVDNIFSKDLKWFFREQRVADFGVDAEVEVVEDGKPTGKLIGLQIKSGSSFFKKVTSGKIRYYGELKHLEYWTNHSLPIYIILHNPEKQITIFQRVERHLAVLTEKGWYIDIPLENRLDATARKILSSGVGSDPESLKRYRFASDKMDMIKYKNHKVFFRFDFWVNKSFGLRGIDVYFDDYQKSVPDENIEIWGPTHSTQPIMRHFFPWLDYELADFEHPDDNCGEIECHILRVKLNKSAKRFLKLEQFYENPDLPYDIDYQNTENILEESYNTLPWEIDNDDFDPELTTMMQEEIHRDNE
ncbi:DUF4365 domain-containing protein [Novacetimonas pomaceti]|uniref:DUF4365 domain-containing protein n=1 Tax=Novacetimonas pomaceti TaxID=2021998 RepID=A0ABX5P9B2_9PROT|nr:DUF4365 domain-containing protein [Novacetimonas pomaceti]PYD48626.1 hypothetical protein C3920_03745 [Novacetimonas pomaceti]